MRFHSDTVLQGLCVAVMILCCSAGSYQVWAAPDDVQNIPDQPALQTPDEQPAGVPVPVPSQQPVQPLQPSFQQSPSQSQTVIVPTPTLPTPSAPNAIPGETVIVVPEVSQPQPPSTVTPVVPKVETPQTTTPVVIPPTPEPRPGTVVVPEKVLIPEPGVAPEKAVVPEKEVPSAKPDAPKTQADFLIKTPEPAPKAPKPEKKEPEPQKAEPKKGVPQKPEPKKEPQKPEPQKPEPKKEPQKPQPPQKGDPMQIPPEAKKTGDVSFLKGCWRGTRPEYYSKRIIIERFCFDEKGIGKRTITDPKNRNQCVGSARAVLNRAGVLRVQSGQGHCQSGETWGVADMLCEGEGNSTPCTWKFDDAGSNARQSYKIQFVRD